MKQIILNAQVKWRLFICHDKSPNKKAFTARVGIAVNAILPFNPPVGMRNILDQIAEVRWLKGLVYIQRFVLEVPFLKDGG